jgi:hypothetical protein
VKLNHRHRNESSRRARSPPALTFGSCGNCCTASAGCYSAVWRQANSRFSELLSVSTAK